MGYISMHLIVEVVGMGADDDGELTLLAHDVMDWISVTLISDIWEGDG